MEVKVNEFNDNRIDSIVLSNDEIGCGYYEDKDGNELYFAEIDVDKIIHFKEEFHEEFGDKLEIITIATVKAKEVAWSKTPKISVTWKDNSFDKNNENILKMIDDSVKELESDFKSYLKSSSLIDDLFDPYSNSSKRKEVNVKIYYKDNDVSKRFEVLMTTSSGVSIEDISIFSLDHLSINSYNKELHWLLLSQKLVIERIEYETDGSIGVIKGSEAELFFKEYSFN